MSFADWPEQKRVVTNLYLDPQNPRIPPAEAGLDQRALLAHLVRHDKIYEIAKNIFQNGYFPVEALIAVKGNKTIYVIEGNRRLAALKLLINPTFAPEDQLPRFRALSGRIDINTIKKVKVMMAPSREAAAPIIMSRHTAVQIEPWKPIMQAKFYHRMLETGLSIDELSATYNISISDILTALRLFKMYQVACSLDLPEKVAEIVQNPREFKATTLRRVYGPKEVMNFLGIGFDDNSDRFTGYIDVSEFKKGFKKIVTDVATGEIKPKDVYSKDDISNYLKSFKKEKPDLNKKGFFTSETLLKSAAKKDIKKITTKKSIKKPKPKPRSLIPRSVTCELNNQRINDIFDELKKLPLAQYPNATAILFRSLFEMSLGHYMYGTGDIAKLIEKEKERRQKRKPPQPLPKSWHPSLQDMLKHLVGQSCDIIKNPNIVKALNKFLSQQDELLSKDSLDFFVHNQFYSPTEDSLRQLWVQLEGLFQIILVEPE